MQGGKAVEKLVRLETAEKREMVSKYWSNSSLTTTGVFTRPQQSEEKITKP